MSVMTILGGGLNGLVILTMGWLGLSLLQRMTQGRDAFSGSGGQVMRWAVIVLLGMAMTAVTAQVWLMVKLQWSLPLWVVDGAMVLALLGLRMWLGRALPAQQHEGDTPVAPRVRLGVMDWLLHGWAGLLGCFALCLAMMNFTRRVWGDWDAVMIWNARARFLDRAGSDWPLAFNQPVIHPDYPLLQPLAVMRGWQYMQGEHPLASILVSLVFFVLAGVLLWATLATTRSRRLASLGVIVLLGNILFLNFGSLQLADVPLATCLMAGWAMIVIALTQNRQGRNRPAALWWVLAGVMLSYAAGTKNEGLLMLLASGAGLLLTHHPRQWLHGFSDTQRGQWRSVMLVTLGAMPIMMMVLGAKLLLAGSNDLVRNQAGTATMLEKLTDLSRHRTIARALWQQLEINPTLWGMTAVIVLGLLCSTRQSWRFGASLGMAAAMLLTASGYWVVYVLTHHDLQWHLQTSLSRLIVHFWPLVVLWAMLQLGLLVRETHASKYMQNSNG